MGILFLTWSMRTDPQWMIPSWNLDSKIGMMLLWFAMVLKTWSRFYWYRHGHSECHAWLCFFFRFEKAEFGDIGMIPPHEDHCTELDPGCSSGAGATISERMDRARSVLENPTDISFTIHGGFLKWGYCTPNHLKLDDFSIWPIPLQELPTCILEP